MSAIGSVAASVTNTVVSEIRENATLSGRSISCLSVVAQTVLWVNVAVAIAAVAVSVFLLFSPGFTAAMPLLALVAPLGLGLSCMGSIFGAIAVAKLTPEKQLERATDDLNQGLDAFRAEIDAKLPETLKAMEESDHVITKAVDNLSHENEELKKAAADFQEMIKAAADSATTLQKGHEALQASMATLDHSTDDMTTRIKLAGEQIASLDPAKLERAVVQLEARSKALATVAESQGHVLKVLNAILQKISDEKTAVVAASTNVAAAAATISALTDREGHALAHLDEALKQEEAVNKALAAFLASQVAGVHR